MPSRRRHSVLIVEDEGIVAMDLQMTLEKMGYDASAVASSSDEAVQWAANRCPDIVLMDIRIKGERDGIETASILRERFDVPIVYLTAHADDATLSRAKATGPYGYLLKPVKAAELRSAIEVSVHRHEMERQLRERERWFSTTLRSIADAVITVDLGGKITFMNPVAEKLVGTSAEEAIGHSARDVVKLLHPDRMTPLSLPLDRALEERTPGELPEAMLVTRENVQRLIGDSSAPVTDGGDVLGAVMVFRDITEQRLVQRQLEVADRLASLGTMAAGVAHEVNNPLAVVVANSQFVADEIAAVATPLRDLGDEGVALSDRLRDAAQAQSDTQAAATRIGRIVADLKAFSRPPERALGEGDVGRALEWAARTTAHEFRHRAQLVTSIPDLPAVRVEETRLGQVFINLLMNAAQAIPPGNTDTNKVTITAEQVADRVIVEVCDTGPGIPAELQARLFEPFFTTKPVGEGTGLGLSICHGIITSAGGEISVRSEVGRGTSFRIALPTSRHRPKETATPIPEYSGRKAHILVLDDETIVHKAIKRILRDHELVCLEDARSAIAMIDAGTHFDVILSDVMMPNMTGLEFYEALLGTHPEVAARIVFVTGGATTARVEAFLRTVPNTVIEKPFGIPEMRRVIEKMLSAPEK